jgi:hypothetical protein
LAAVTFGGSALVLEGQSADSKTAAAPKAVAGKPGAPEHVVLTSEQDRKRMMDMLKITMFPSGPQAYWASTYDQNTADPYPNLPDPLTFNNGSKVTSASQWRRRRAEIVELFDREVYGRRPVTPKVTWKVVSTVDTTSNAPQGNLVPGGAAPPAPTTPGVPIVTKTLVGTVDNSSYPALTVNIIATLSVPKSATGPVPVVLAFGGGATPEGITPTTPCVVPGQPAPGARAGGAGAAAGRAAGAGAAVAGRAAGAGRAGGAANPAPSPQEQIYSRGWGYATVSTGSIQADNGQGLTCGIIGLVNKGQPRKLDDWGVLSAWGWGMSRVLDYLETDKSVDATRVATHGHSRTGKAAFVAMAYDERFANGFISSSGQSGAKLHRRKYGEAIENIVATNEYHWMAGNYMKYAGRWDTLPVDSHSMVAMIAPRPVFLSTGNGPNLNPDGSVKMMAPGDPSYVPSRGPIEQMAENINDAWVDSKGTFLAGVGAGPVYRLLGKKDLGTSEFPAIETSLVSGEIGFRQHTGGHTPGPNWPIFLEFAAKYWNATKPAVSAR